MERPLADHRHTPSQETGNPFFNSSAEKVESPTVYYDVLAEQIILGKVALDSHIQSGGHPADIIPLSEALTNESIGINRKREKVLWTPEECIEGGRWLIGLVQEVDNGSKKTLNGSVLNRAAKLDIIDAPHRLRRVHFSSLGEFYTKLDLKDAHRTHGFKDWSRADFIDYLASCCESAGRRITYKELLRISNSDPRLPSPNVVANRFGGRKIGPVMELAGYPDVYSWGESEFIDWGVKFMLANNGLVPSANKIAYFSKQGKGPSSRTIMDKFIKLSDYQTLVIEQYKAAIQSNKEEMKRKGLEIKAAIDDGTLDAKFFRGVKSGTEMIKRFAAFNLAASALPNHSRYDVRKLTEGLSPESTINLIKRMMPALNIEDLEMIAITGGYYEDLWPPEHNNRLKLPAEMITKNTLTTTRVISAV